MRGPPGAGWSSLAARRAHNPKVAGSNPAPATINTCHVAAGDTRDERLGWIAVAIEQHLRWLGDYTDRAQIALQLLARQVDVPVRERLRQRLDAASDLLGQTRDQALDVCDLPRRLSLDKR